MPEVIDWDEAMQQCGDDEEFLRELLEDLRDETDTQMQKIDETVKVKAYNFKSFSKKQKGDHSIEDSVFLRDIRATPDVI